MESELYHTPQFKVFEDKNVRQGMVEFIGVLVWLTTFSMATVFVYTKAPQYSMILVPILAGIAYGAGILATGGYSTSCLLVDLMVGKSVYKLLMAEDEKEEKEQESKQTRGEKRNRELVRWKIFTRNKLGISWSSNKLGVIAASLLSALLTLQWVEVLSGKNPGSMDDLDTDNFTYDSGPLSELVNEFFYHFILIIVVVAIRKAEEEEGNGEDSNGALKIDRFVQVFYLTLSFMVISLAFGNVHRGPFNIFLWLARLDIFRPHLTEKQLGDSTSADLLILQFIAEYLGAICGFSIYQLIICKCFDRNERTEYPMERYPRLYKKRQLLRLFSMRRSEDAAPVERYSHENWSDLLVPDVIPTVVITDRQVIQNPSGNIIIKNVRL